MNLLEASFFGDFTLTSLIPVIVIAVLAVITVIRRRKKGKTALRYELGVMIAVSSMMFLSYFVTSSATADLLTRCVIDVMCLAALIISFIYE